jgi:hypothetical protein
MMLIRSTLVCLSLYLHDFSIDMFNTIDKYVELSSMSNFLRT